MDMKAHTKYGKAAGKKKAFAFVRDASTKKVYRITTSESIFGRKLAALKKKDGKLNGIKYSMKSKTKCPYGKDKKTGKPLMFKWTAKITCNKEIKEKGGAKIVGVEGLTTCNPTVIL